MSENSNPFFSVVIPAYNRLSMVRDTIDSVLKQTFTDFEIIVVDDGSTDHSTEILRKEYVGENRLQIITQENLERGAARNNGIKNSRGKYIQFLDSDDLLFENHLEIIQSKIVEQNFPDFICTKYVMFRNGNSYPSDILKLSEGYYDYKLFLSGNPLACNVCVKRDNPRLHYFEEDRKYSIKEDWMFMLQNMYESKLYLIDKVSLKMNDHESRSMRSDNEVIVSKTFFAKEWIDKNISLNAEERKILDAHVNYFCGIHCYIDNRRIEGLQYVRKAISSKGPVLKYLVLYVKLLLGVNSISRLKKITGR